MLTSILPGLRDLRVPLASGLLWLVVIWLFVYPMIPTKDEASGFGAEVYELFGALGGAALLGAVTFVAYILGIVFGKLSSLTKFAAGRLTSNKEALSRASDVQASERATKLVSQLHEKGIPFELISNLLENSDTTEEAAHKLATLEKDMTHELRAEIAESDVQKLTDRMFTEIPLVAARLLAKNKDLFDRYDRADAEANFRYAVIIPMTLIVLLVVIRTNLLATIPWLAVFIIVATLGFAFLIARDAYLKERESNDAIYQAVFIGEVNFPVMDDVQSLFSHPLYRTQGKSSHPDEASDSEGSTS